MTVSLSTNTACAVLPGARVEIWHCDATGLYSDVAQNNTRNQEFLRGYQIADENGVVNFTTIYPGWYMGRAVHIHFKVRTYSGDTRLDEFTSHFFLR
jgi:protocatechuate 3,4-dioxygenase beta subunit